MKYGEDENYRDWSERFVRNDPYLFEEIYAVVKSDTMAYIRSKSRSRLDAEDILSEVEMKVFTHLGEYFRESANKSVGERNMWLKLIALRTCIDFYRRKYHKLKTGGELSDSNGYRPEFEYLSDVGTGLLAVEALREAVIDMLQLDSKPEKVLCYVLYAFLLEDYGDSKKAYVGWVNDNVQGSSLYDLLAWVKRLLKRIELEDGHYAKLERSLEREVDGVRYGERPLDSSARDIVVWLSDMRRKMRDAGMARVGLGKGAHNEK